MDNANMKQTLFDSMLTNRNLQILKAVLPYIDYDTGKISWNIYKISGIKKFIFY